MSQSQYKFCLGDRPTIWGGVELRGRVWYPVKVLLIRYNLFAGTEMLSLSVYEPIAIQILLGDRSPILGIGLSWWSSELPVESPPY